MVSDYDQQRIRHSRAESSVVVEDDDEKARIEAANALRQTERVREYVMQVIDGRPFKLRPSILLDLNRCAIIGLDPYAGLTRPAGIGIAQSKHQPPEAHLVPELLEELCDYINEQWELRSALHLAAFVMWRLNWIHPFTEGNGRTSRAASYLVLCAKERAWFPGVTTIPDQIVANRHPYYEALEAADRAYKAAGRSFNDQTVTAMEDLLGSMFANQLRSAFENAAR